MRISGTTQRSNQDSQQINRGTLKGIAIDQHPLPTGVVYMTLYNAKFPVKKFRKKNKMMLHE
jgi:hypothetical protein